MNQDQFQSFWKNLKAPLQAKWAKLTDGDLHEIDGNMMKFYKVIDMRYGERKGEVSRWVTRRYAHWKELYVV